MTGKLKKLLKRKVFWTFLFSYFVVILLPMFVLIYSFSNSLELVKQRLEISDRLVLEQYFSGIDAQLLTVMKIADHVAFDTATSYFSNRDDIKGKIKSAYAYQNIEHLLLQLSNISTVNENIKDCCIYYTYSDRIVSFDGIYTSEFYFRQKHSNQYVGYEQWLKTITDVSDAGFISQYPDSAGGKQTEQGILYVRRVQWYKTQPPVFVVIVLDNSVLDRQSSLINLKQGSTMTILNSGLNILYSSNPGFTPPYQYITEDDYGSFVTNEENPASISWIRSDATGCIYFLTLPGNLYSSQLAVTRTINILIISTTLITGILISLILASRRYQPIQALREFAGTIADSNSSSYNGEDFMYLQGIIRKLANEKQNAEQKLMHQNNLIKNSLIERLLYVNFPKVLPDEERLASTNISFDSTDFAVAIFRTKPSNTIIQKSFDDIKSLLANDSFWKELLGKWYNVYLTQIDNDNTVILINFRSGSYNEQKKVLKDTMDFCHKMITKEFKITLSLYVSDVQHSFAGIHKAFRDALFLSEYYHGTGEVVFVWEDLPDNRFNIYYSYKPETEQRLINLVSTGKTDEARELILKVHEENTRNLPPWFEKVIIMDLLSSCLKSVNIVYNSEDGKLKDIRKKMRQLLHRDPEKYCINDVLEILDMICDAADCTTNSTKTVSIEERVRTIIRKEYGNYELNVSLIAKYLDINPGYLSALYKKCTNESIVDTINLYRLNMAEKLLTNTSKDIKDIAVMVGYNNSAGFIRVFKKYKGVTPGQFRNMLA